MGTAVPWIIPSLYWPANGLRRTVGPAAALAKLIKGTQRAYARRSGPPHTIFSLLIGKSKRFDDALHATFGSCAGLGLGQRGRKSMV